MYARLCIATILAFWTALAPEAGARAAGLRWAPGLPNSQSLSPLGLAQARTR